MCAENNISEMSVIPARPTMPTLPPAAAYVLSALTQAGFEAYLVGGCVRDFVMGQAPGDLDVATNGHPEQVMAVFKALRVIPTGLKHGTVTVLVPAGDGDRVAGNRATGDRVTGEQVIGGCAAAVEITTYRVDCAYTDHRRPDEVLFTQSLEADLSRRDFTMNAMAYDGRCLIDPFGGVQDIQSRTLRCVGDPNLRFQEDALRIMRALRFASVLSFDLEPETHRALLRHRALLAHVSMERIQKELQDFLCGKNVRSLLLTYPAVLGVFIPELLPMVGFAQCSPYHAYDLWRHSVETVAAVPAVAVYRLAALLHDIGKPQCFSRDAQGIGHFYGHASLGKSMTETILKRLKIDKETSQRVTTVVQYHDCPLEPDAKKLKRWLNKLGETGLRDLIQVQRADHFAQGKGVEGRQAQLNQVEALVATLLAEQACFSRKDLAVKGETLLALGYSGKAVGEALELLLECVIQEQVVNEREALLAYLEQCQVERHGSRQG